MKVVIINNDLRIFWKGRVSFLKEYLAEQDIELYAIELFGKGSPYSFDSYTNEQKWWSCLFPDNDASALSKEQIAASLFLKLNIILPDVIISSSIVFYAGALSMRWAKQNKRKFIMFDDAKPWQVKRNFLIQRIKDLIISQSDALWLPSAEYDDDYAHFKKLGIDFFYGYNCINNDFFKGAPKNQLDHKVIICVARLVQIKNIEGLLRAWQLVEEQTLAYKLLIVGNGPESERLTVIIKELKLNGVKLAGSVGNENMPAFYHQSNALILPSFSETWGLVVNEAMAAGLPLLLSNKVNAGKSLLVNGENGFSFEPTDTNDMVDAILKFIRADDHYKTGMSTRSLEIIKQMNYENMGRQLHHTLLKLAKVNFKKPGPIAFLIIKNWFGRYNTSGWDKL